MRYFLYISFNGSNFCGWQKQPNGISVQETVEKALEVLFRIPCTIVGAGRTDAGVHAYELPAHADLPQASTSQIVAWQRSLNGILPHDIYIRKIVPVKNNAHARFDAVMRTYKYFVALEQDPFTGPYVLPTHSELNYTAMNEAAKALIGEHDFTSFTKLHNDSKHNRCILYEAYWQPAPYPNCHVFTISANRFLRNMVRTVVGTLLEVGKGKLPTEQIGHILRAENRSFASATAKPHPLFLTKVSYPNDIFL